MKRILNKLKSNHLLIINLSILLLMAYLLIIARSIERGMQKMVDDLTMQIGSISQSQFRLEQSQHPKVTGNQDFNGERSHFTFSPNRKLIAFVQNVFDEYGNDWEMYWALNIFDPETDEERTLVIDDTKMSSYEWLDNETIRVYHNAGTGVRVYLDVPLSRAQPLFTKDYEGPDIWTPDAEYSRKARDNMEARRVYFGEH
jgi:hypothetical protein